MWETTSGERGQIIELDAGAGLLGPRREVRDDAICRRAELGFPGFVAIDDGVAEVTGPALDIVEKLSALRGFRELMSRDETDGHSNGEKEYTLHRDSPPVGFQR